MVIFPSALAKIMRDVYLVTAVKNMQGLNGKESRAARRPDCCRGLFFFAYDLHDDPRTEDESFAEAVVGHRADKLVVDINKLE